MLGYASAKRVLELGRGVFVAAAWNLRARQGGEFSLPGLFVTVLAIPVMYSLSQSKLHLAESLGSRALRADAIESITCLYLAVVVVIALIVQFLLERQHVHGWWVAPVASLGIVWLLVKEGREAREGDECDDG